MFMKFLWSRTCMDVCAFFNYKALIHKTVCPNLVGPKNLLKKLAHFSSNCRSITLAL